MSIGASEYTPERIAVLKRKANQKKILKKTVAYFCLAVGAFVFVIPFIWSVSTSLKDEVDVKDGRWIPKPITWSNFKRAWEKGKFGRAYMNSMIVGVCVTAGQVITSALAAFAFARLKFPGRDKLFLGYLGTMMIPFIVIAIPNFVLLDKLKLIDSYGGLILPLMFTAYGTFMLRQFFITIPQDLEDAAVIDGASKMSIFLRIVVPLSKAAIATLTTFTFMNNWNEYMWPLIVVHSDKFKTLPWMLKSFQGIVTDTTLVMAGSLIVLIPVILVYILNQKFITKGIVLSGLKG